MADVTIIIVHQMFIVRPRCLFHFIHIILSPCSKLATILKDGLITESASQIVSFVSSAQVLFETRKGEEFFYI